MTNCLPELISFPGDGPLAPCYCTCGGVGVSGTEILASDDGGTVVIAVCSNVRK